ncbi:hypothetical protein J6590_066734 [Homalodisca vitripennis]|nr:hypothetical protein J6590_066734 [Homalodisca vitripennis]
MKILDNFKNEVIHLERPLACDSCWFPCCLQKMEVYAPPGCLVGTVEQDWSILAPAFSIKNAAGDTVLRIEGPVCTMSICGSDVEFNDHYPLAHLTGREVVQFKVPFLARNYRSQDFTTMSLCFPDAVSFSLIHSYSVSPEGSTKDLLDSWFPSSCRKVSS